MNNVKRVGEIIHQALVLDEKLSENSSLIYFQGRTFYEDFNSEVLWRKLYVLFIIQLSKLGVPCSIGKKNHDTVYDFSSHEWTGGDVEELDEMFWEYMNNIDDTFLSYMVKSPYWCISNIDADEMFWAYSGVDDYEEYYQKKDDILPDRSDFYEYLFNGKREDIGDENKALFENFIDCCFVKDESYMMWLYDCLYEESSADSISRYTYYNKKASELYKLLLEHSNLSEEELFYRQVFYDCIDVLENASHYGLDSNAHPFIFDENHFYGGFTCGLKEGCSDALTVYSNLNRLLPAAAWEIDHLIDYFFERLNR